MNMYWGSAGIVPFILNLGEWSTSLPGRFTIGERAPGTHKIGGWPYGMDAVAMGKKKTSTTFPAGN